MTTTTWLISALRLRKGFVLAAVVIGLISILAHGSNAGVFTLVDDNSHVEFDTNSPDNAIDWVVDGQDQLVQQGFWYRVGNVGPEQPLSTLAIGPEGVADTNLDLLPDTLFVRYTDPAFQIDTTYTLSGGLPGSGASDMVEHISITNLTAAPLNFHFFQYVDFDLLGTSGGDTGVFTNSNMVQQFEGAQRLTETIVTPVPNHREISVVPVILGKLNDAVATTLSDTPAINTPLGPDDVAWSYQWDALIPVGGTFRVSKDKNLSADTIPGDVNGNGMVDAADYALWRSDPDAYGGSDEYALWVSNFGQTLGSGSASSLTPAVPEPTSAWLLSLAAAFAICTAHRIDLRVPQRSPISMSPATTAAVGCLRGFRSGPGRTIRV